MSKHKSNTNKDYQNTTLTEAIEWVKANCMFDHNRKNIKSRAVAYVLLASLDEALEIIQMQEKELNTLRSK